MRQDIPSKLLPVDAAESACGELLHMMHLDRSIASTHDRSPVHTSKLVRSTLDYLRIQTLEWPPKGADINLIENIWGLMKRRISRRTIKTDTKEALWSVIHAVWEELKSDRSLMSRLYASLPGRIQDIVEAQGAFTRH